MIQDTQNTKPEPQAHPSDEALATRGTFGLTHKRCGRFALGLLVALLAGCGSNADPAAVQVPTLDGARTAAVPVADVTPAIDLAKAPTNAHRKLGGLLPPKTLVQDTVEFGGWDAEAAGFVAGDPTTAAMPVVRAEYLSSGFQLEGESAVKQKYPQACSLYLIKAPEAMAAEPVARAIREKLKSKGFTEREPLELIMGVRDAPTAEASEVVVSKVGDDQKNRLRMDRFTSVATESGVDKVYVAYVSIVGDVVIYALEAETQQALVAPDGTRITGIADGPRGISLGGQLVSLVHDRK